MKMFGEILIKEGKITKEQLEHALKLQKDNPERKIGEILVTLNYITKEDIIETVKKQYEKSGKTPPDTEKWLSQNEIDKIIEKLVK
jgi:phage-related tail protein